MSEWRTVRWDCRRLQQTLLRSGSCPGFGCEVRVADIERVIAQIFLFNDLLQEKVELCVKLTIAFASGVESHAHNFKSINHSRPALCMRTRRKGRA